MPSLELKDTHCRYAKTPTAEEGQRDTWDTAVRGFGLRVSPRGKKVFFVMVRVRGLGTQRRITIGEYSDISLADAREEAVIYKRMARRGQDPRKEIEARKRELARKSLENDRREQRTFETLVQFYVDEYAKVEAPRTWKESERILRKDAIRPWEKIPLDRITRHDVKALLHEKKSKAPIAANRLYEVLRTFFEWAATEEYIDASPIAGLKKPSPENERERTLSDDEILAIWTAADEKLGHPFGTMVKLLFITAQRRNEVAGMQWSELDLDSGSWSIPGARSKNGKGHLCPLPSLAIEILKATHETGAYVISSGVRGDKPVSGFSKAKRLLDKHSGVTGWRFHDIRRTVATKICGLGIDRVTVSKVLNHSEGGVTKVYDRYAADPEKEQALRRWGEKLRRIVASEPK